MTMWGHLDQMLIKASLRENSLSLSLPHKSPEAKRIIRVNGSSGDGGNDDGGGRDTHNVTIENRFH